MIVKKTDMQNVCPQPSVVLKYQRGFKGLGSSHSMNE